MDTPNFIKIENLDLGSVETEEVAPPTPEYPGGSWLYKVAGEVKIATGYFVTLYPGKPSPYPYDVPYVFVNLGSR